METSAPGDRSAAPPMTWTAAAEEYLKEVPGVFRRRARAAIEEFAHERGYPEVTPAVMKEARQVLLGF